VPIYSGSLPSPGISGLYLFVYVIYDLKLYVNYIELDVGEAGVGLGYSEGEKLWGVCHTWGENGGLVISVEQRHRTSVDGYSCTVCAF
jgi:hypothetical protein